MPIPNLTSQTYVDNALAAKLDLAGGTMTGGLTLSASGIIFSDATYLTTAPAGSTLAADQLTAGVVTANPTAGPTASGDVLQYDGSALIWAPGGGGGGVAWGAITGTVTDQTDLVTYVTGLGYQTASDVSTYVSANAYPLSGNPSGFLTSVPAKTVYTVTSNAYTLVAGDANNIVYVPPGASGGFPPVNISVPDDATYAFPTGTTILVVVNNVTGASDVNIIPLGFGAPIIIGTVQIPSASTSGMLELVKVDADLWIVA